MSSALVLAHGEKLHKISAAGSGTDAVKFFRSLEDVHAQAHDKLGVPPGTYDLYDRYGKIKCHGDLLRALEKAGAGECTVEIREHHHFERIRGVETETTTLADRIRRLEDRMDSSEQSQNDRMDEVKDSLKAMIQKVDRRITDDVNPSIASLTRDKKELARQLRSMQEKMAELNIQEMRDLMTEAHQLRDDLTQTAERFDVLDKQWDGDKGNMHEAMRRLHDECKELRRYMQGKIDVCIETDADLRHDEQLLGERMQLLGDEAKLLKEDHKRLERQCRGALEESEELRTLLGKLREDNEYLRMDCGQTRTRVHCIEGTTTDRWEDFVATVQFFRQWHKKAKGPDVQLSPDSAVATGRGFLAATGMVSANDEGLAVADGPCRRFGTPGMWSSYYELQVDEVCAAPEAAGGLYVGLAIQSAEEINGHPRHEFDGWLVGGSGKALVCRAGSSEGLAKEPDAKSLPATWNQAAGKGAAEAALKAVQLLYRALPPRPKGEVKETRSMWASKALQVGDRVGVLFRCNREGGARMKIAVNGDVVATHEFMEAPPAEAVGLLTPVVRLAGAGKSAKLLPGLQPPSHMLVG